MTLTDLVRKLALGAALAVSSPACDSGSTSSPYCTADYDCKGDRICVKGECQNPPQKESSSSQPSTPEPTCQPEEFDLCDGVDNTCNGVVDDLGCGNWHYLKHDFGDNTNTINKFSLNSGLDEIILNQKDISQIGWFSVAGSGKIAVVTFNDKLYVYGSTPQLLLPKGASEEPYGIQFIPTWHGSSTILFSGTCGGQSYCTSEDNGNFKILSIQQDGSQLQRLLPTSFDPGCDEYQPAVHEDLVAFIQDCSGKREAVVYDMDTKETSAVTENQVAKPINFVHWSPKGNALYFDGSNKTLNSISLNGYYSLIAQGVSIPFAPSPDDSKIAFLSTEEGLCVKTFSTDKVHCTNKVYPLLLQWE